MPIYNAAKRFILRGRGIDSTNIDKTDLALKNLELEDEIQKLKPRYKFENNSFLMYLPDGTPASINFTDIRGRGDMLDMFRALIDLLQERVQVNKGWFWVFISKQDLRKKISR